MRPATAPSADGPFNLWQAIYLAGSSLSYGQGVLALFSSTIYSARDIQKISNYKIDAFEKANTALGFMKDDEIFFSSRQMKKHTTSSIFSSMDLSHLPEVDIVRIMQEQIHIFYILVLRALSSWVQVVETFL